MCLSGWMLLGKSVTCISGCCYISLSRYPKKATWLVFLFIVTYGDHWTLRTTVQYLLPKRCAKTWSASSYPNFLVCKTDLLSWFLWKLLYHTEIVYDVSLLVCWYSITLHYSVESLGNVLMKLNISLKILQLVRLKLNVHPMPRW